MDAPQPHRSDEQLISRQCTATSKRSGLRSPLLSVLAWAIDPENPDVTGVKARFEAKLANPDTAPMVLTEGEAYPATALRVLQMLDTLETDGFVSFG